MAWALDSRRTGPLFAQARLVLVALADYTDPEGRGAYPSVPTLAERLDLSERTVQRHLSSLVDDGLITEGDAQLVSHYRAGYRPKVYDLCMSGDTGVTAGRGDSSDPAGVTGVTDSAGRGDTESAGRGDTGVTQSKNLTTNENPTPYPLPDDDAAALAIEHAQADALWTWCNRCHQQTLKDHACHPVPMPEDFRGLVAAAREEPSP
jgi:DNA-binding transcriptional ArsR family regulator